MDKVENLLLEHLKRFQAGQDRIERELDEVVTRLGHLEISMAGLRRDIGHGDEQTAVVSVRLDKMNERLERVEKRLELQ